MLAFLGNVFDPLTLAIILAGSFAIAGLQNGSAAFGRAFAALRPLFTANPRADRTAARATMLRVDELAHLRGLACTDRVRTGNPFLSDAVRKLANCDSIEAFEQWVAEDLSDRAERHASARNLWNSVADVAPALGMAGTVLGLIGMFMAMDDPDAIGPAMAVALLTTLYGVVLSNLIAAPIAGRLADLSDRELRWQRELADRMLVIIRRESAPLRRVTMRDVA